MAGAAAAAAAEARATFLHLMAPFARYTKLEHAVLAEDLNTSLALQGVAVMLHCVRCDAWDSCSYSSTRVVLLGFVVATTMLYRRQDTTPPPPQFPGASVVGALASAKLAL